ncbi:MAG: anthranilate synthase component I [Firmicutes bacterium]|nr:anthranilate synthase component I [Bacillota bacterium]
MGLPLKPDLKEFARLARTGLRVPVWVELIEDEITPISALKSFIEEPGCFLLESVIAGEKVGRYSFLGMSPQLTFTARGEKARIEDHAGGEVRETSGRVVETLRGIINQNRTARPEGCPSFCGGAVGYFGYEFAGQLEGLPLHPNHTVCPDVYLMFYDSVYIFDHLKRSVMFLTNLDAGRAYRESGDQGINRLYLQAEQKIMSMIERLIDSGGRGSRMQPIFPNLPSEERPERIQSNLEPEQFCRLVEQAKEHISAGDIFQIVLSQRFSVGTTASGLELYRALRLVNPSPYMFYLNCRDFEIIGSSPEAHVKLESGRASIRPIAGTRRRGGGRAADQELAAELLADEKERAEHIMLVDLARNDLGRVCDYGTVQVEELMAVEFYSHVMHIVSNVTGRLREGEDALSLICSTFPAGTLSGAPKIRAMELIAGLETTPRGPYAGALGYISFHGDLDTAIVIRTMVRAGDQVSFQVGAGIVADSIPLNEHLEIRHKSQAMVSALNLLEVSHHDLDN